MYLWEWRNTASRNGKKSYMRSHEKAGKSEGEKLWGSHHILDERHGDPLFSKVQIMSKAREQPDRTAGRKDNSSVGFCWFFALAGELPL